MRGIMSIVKRQAKEITKDGMMIAMIPVPLFVALILGKGIPYLDSILMQELNKTQLLKPYYLIFDLLIAVMMPLVFCTIYSMILLSEFDDKTANYLIITPVGMKGYVIASLVIPGFIGSVLSGILLFFFSLTEFTVIELIVLMLFTFTTSIIACLFVVGFSSNKVEGVAFSKFTSFFMLGIPVPFFLEGKIQYAAGIIPSFWVTKYLYEDDGKYLIGFVLVTAVWSYFLSHKFSKKLQ